MTITCIRCMDSGAEWPRLGSPSCCFRDAAVVPAVWTTCSPRDPSRKAVAPWGDVKAALGSQDCSLEEEVAGARRSVHTLLLQVGLHGVHGCALARPVPVVPCTCLGGGEQIGHAALLRPQRGRLWGEESGLKAELDGTGGQGADGHDGALPLPQLRRGLSPSKNGGDGRERDRKSSGGSVTGVAGGWQGLSENNPASQVQKRLVLPTWRSRSLETRGTRQEN